MSDAIFTSLISGGCALIGAAIGLVGALGIAKRASEAEERKHFRLIGIEIGKAKFEQSMILAQRAAEATGQIISVPSYESHLVHGLRLIEIISDTRLSAEEVGIRIARSVDFTKEITSSIKDAEGRK